MNGNKYFLLVGSKNMGPFRALGDGGFELMKTVKGAKEQVPTLLALQGREAKIMDPNGSELAKGTITKVTGNTSGLYLSVSSDPDKQ